MRIKFLIILLILIPFAFAVFPQEKDNSINTQELTIYDQFDTYSPLIINQEKNKIIGTNKVSPWPMLITDDTGATIY